MGSFSDESGKSGKPLSETQKLIMSHLRINGASATNQINSSLDLPLSTLTYNLNKLHEMGLISKEGERRKTTWNKL